MVSAETSTEHGGATTERRLAMKINRIRATRSVNLASRRLTSPREVAALLFGEQDVPIHLQHARQPLIGASRVS